MNRFTLIAVLALSVTLICTGCNKEVRPEEKILGREINFIGIEDISFENYPKVEGSASATILNRMVALKMLDVRYFWRSLVAEYFLFPYSDDFPEQHRSFIDRRVKTSPTHNAFMNLINGEADIIVTHRTISPEEKAHADSIGVALIETSIAMDAFVFVVNRTNPVKSLTVDEIRDI